MNKTMTDNATKKPWHYTEHEGKPKWIFDINKYPIANFNLGTATIENAKLIVKAVNMHEELIEALKLSLKYTKLEPHTRLYERDELVKILKNVLSKAKEV